ncbi:hypothetical protein MMYC01_203611 [Madurella mycetomatis]|uniref:Uncharacterized protein n=1 Tax=Madurella mycetomatis TaxID=100816 RepID=A0A175WAK6_9PEZI|nr:hypothetical protein MMYC01_203611 [Madurella mycetomatis]
MAKGRTDQLRNYVNNNFANRSFQNNAPFRSNDQKFLCPNIDLSRKHGPLSGKRNPAREVARGVRKAVDRGAGKVMDVAGEAFAVPINKAKRASNTAADIAALPRTLYTVAAFPIKAVMAPVKTAVWATSLASDVLRIPTNRKFVSSR